MLSASNHAALAKALAIVGILLLLLFFSASVEAKCPFAGMTLPDPEALQGARERESKVGHESRAGVVRT